MTVQAGPEDLDGAERPLVVRLHDDVHLGPVVVRSGRVLRLSPRALELLADRTLVVRGPVESALATRLVDLDLASVTAGCDPVPGGELTVVVPVRDDHAGAARLLSAVGPGIGVVVVDDASHDPAALAVVVRRHGATLVRLDDNVGPAAARNAGLRHVTTPYVALVDADVEVSGPDLLALAGGLAGAGAVVVAPRVRTRGGRRWFQRYEDACGSLDLGPRPATVRPLSPVAYVPTACLVARTSALADGFDPDLRSGEDVDLVWRLVGRGDRVRYDADVHAWHSSRPTVRSWLGRKALYGSSAAGLTARHGDLAAPAVLGPSAAATLAALATARPLALPVVLAVLVHRAAATRRRLPDAGAAHRRAVTVFSLRVTLEQGAGLALRHWWPLSLAVAARSRRFRRLLALGAVAEAVVARRRSGAQLDLPRFVLARRLDDLAYGAGVWWGAARQRSVRCLLPARPEEGP